MGVTWYLAALVAAAPEPAGVGLHLVTSEQVAAAEATLIGGTLRALIHTWTGEARVVVDDLTWAECRSAGAELTLRCARDVRERLGVRDVVIVELEDAGPKLRVVAELHTIERAEAGAIAEIPREPDAAEAALAPLVRALFAPSKRAAYELSRLRVAVPPPPPPPRVEHVAPWPWLAFGASAVLATTGVVLALSAGDARTRLETAELTPSEARELAAAGDGRALASGLTLGAAATAAAAGALLLIFDETP